jgi:GABA(A) receptor-associated protein
MSDFKARNSFVNRVAEFERIRQRFPGRLPIIVERALRATDAPPLTKQKFLAPEGMSVGQFLYVLRKNMELPAEKALFIFCGDMLPTTAMQMKALYHEYRDKDGFLYLSYSSESTFGAGGLAF